MANARGPIRTGDPAGATTWALTSSAAVQSAMVTAPQQAQVLDSSWYSVMTGAGTGGRSTTCRRSDTVAGAPVNDRVHPEQCPGSIGMTRSGVSEQRPGHSGIPGLLPRLTTGTFPRRPRLRGFLAPR